MTAMNSIDEIIELMNSSSDQEYIGEPLSQLDHALQCAHQAALAGADMELMLAALLHDIGHLCLPHGAQMDGLGIVDHESIGAAYLIEHGFSLRLASLVKGHVDAKRYLCYRHPSYNEKLSDASRRTLIYQGGPMNSEQALGFESDELFKAALQLRTWDEAAKDPDAKVPQLSCYRPMLDDALTSKQEIERPGR